MVTFYFKTAVFPKETVL